MEKKYEAELSFLASEPFFKGHYPGRPVTPGVMLIDKAVRAAEHMLGRKVAVKSIRKVKFSAPVLPEETVLLKLDRRAEGESAYSFSRDGTQCACGILFVV